MSLQQEGTITFQCRHEHADWATNENGYNFPEVQHGPISAQAVKYPEGVFEVTIRGPFDDSFTFSQPVPEIDERGLAVAITWKDRQVNLFLNGEPSESKDATKILPRDYKLNLTQLFEKDCERRFRISKDEARATVAEPDQTHKIDLGDGVIYLTMKQFGNYHVLMQCMIRKGESFADFGLKVYEDLADGFTEKDPLQVLQAVATRFGFPVQIGSRQGLFLLKEQIALSQTGGDIVRVNVPPNRREDSVIVQTLFKLKDSGRLKVVDCALAYAIDVKRYTDWLKSHKRNR